MKFSFLMCVNKSGPFLREAIESVLTQTDGDFLFYIIANNCSDSLWNFLHQLPDPRIRLFRTRIGQLAFNLNFGLDQIEDGYVLRMDADDISLPTRLETTREQLLAHGYPDVMGGGAVLVNALGESVGVWQPPLSDREIRRRLWYSSPLMHPTCAIRVSSILQLRGYLGGFMSEDYDLWLRAARNPNFVFCNVSQQFIKYRISEDQTRGQALGYAETASYMVREFLLGSGFRYFAGAVAAILKRYLLARRKHAG